MTVAGTVVCDAVVDNEIHVLPELLSGEVAMLSTVLVCVWVCVYVCVCVCSVISDLLLSCLLIPKKDKYVCVCRCLIACISAM